MNSFAHALPFLDQSYFAVGCCIPDWLTAWDRKCRVREKRAASWVDDDDPIVRQVARGVVQHHQDDDWFHRSPAFQSMNMQLAIDFRERYGNDQTMRPSLIAHVVIEMLIDSFLGKTFVGKMQELYELIDGVEANAIQGAINRFATRPTIRLVPAMASFLKERYLFDYQTDQGVRYRMNRVLERLELKPMPEASLDWLAEVRNLVDRNASALLVDYVVDVNNPGK